MLDILSAGARCLGKGGPYSGGFWKQSEPGGLRSLSLLRRAGLVFIPCTARGVQTRKHTKRSLMQTSLYFNLFLLFPIRQH